MAVLAAGPLVGTGRDAVAGASPVASGAGFVTTAGVEKVAGTGSAGYSGDGATAVDARLDAPAGIAFDPRGDLFIADAGNCRVREVPAVTGMSFGRPVRAGDIVTLVGGPCGRSAQDLAPTALAVDRNGDLVVSFGSAARVDELAAQSSGGLGKRVRAGALTPIAGTGVPGFNGDGHDATSSELDDPTGVAVDSSGDVLIADTANCRLRLVAARDGNRYGLALHAGDIYTVAGNGICGSAGDGGPASQAELWDPGALAVGPGDDVFIADQGNRTIRELATSSGTSYGIALGVDQLGTVAGEGSYGPYLNDGLPATGPTAELNFPSAIAVGADGSLYVADGAMHVIRLVTDATTHLYGTTLAAGVLATVAGAQLTGNLRQDTTWVRTAMNDPDGLALTGDGRLIFSDRGANVVRELSLGG